MKTCVRVIALLLSLACLVLPAAAGEAVALRGIAEDSVPDATGIGAAAVWNIENETFVYEHNIDALLAPASLVKLMTAVCAYEVLGDRMDETLTVEYSMIAAASGNQVGYYVGETISIRDLFGGLLTRGANDCAYLLAYAADGGCDRLQEPDRHERRGRSHHGAGFHPHCRRVQCDSGADRAVRLGAV